MSSSILQPLFNEPWSCMLPGPPSRNNFGSADLSPSGLLAFASGSSVSVVDSRSLHLVTTVPLPYVPSPPSSSPPPNSSAPVSPFVTSVRWTPLPPRRDLLSTEPSSSHLIIAAADRYGRISLVDFRLRSIILSIDPPDHSSKWGVQDLCWVQARPDSFLLAALSGPSHVSFFNASTYRFSFVRCFAGTSVELLIRTDCKELLKLERDAAAAGNSTSTPASAVSRYMQCVLAFSPHWKHVHLRDVPEGMVVFDLKYETTLFSAALPRGCSKFLDVLPDPNQELVYCAHLDGKLSIWRRKEGEQVHILRTVEDLMPSFGSYVPSSFLLSAPRQQHKLNGSRSQLPSSIVDHPDVTFKISLIRQLQLLSSTVDRSGSAIPFLNRYLGSSCSTSCLGTQNGTIDVIDVSANTVAAGFSVHSKVSDKIGGYNNRLIVTCLRSGLNRTFRALQKPERSAVRALRASSSGRYLLIIRDAVEVWAMTKNPIMLIQLRLQKRQPHLHGIFIRYQELRGSHEDNSEFCLHWLMGTWSLRFKAEDPRLRFSCFFGDFSVATDTINSQVMGDRVGYIRRWDVTTGQSFSFNTRREGIRRIKFSPVVTGDCSRGRVAVLF
ncbi:Actin related protein isoform 1 [Hibiscus syriacus]|uniref:Actin related protein isoform 1 n=1 Tax=Hibiscus syriacus TaxID=106335 RepID=A0A6A3A222_HIBSY|nr:Actin related protein isoform 1 [Hibiscus syriacus]